MAIQNPNPLIFFFLLLLALSSQETLAISESELDEAISALRSRGYHLFGNAITASDVCLDLLLSNQSHTLFAATDAALFSLDMSSDADHYVAALRRHVALGRHVALHSLQDPTHLLTLAPHRSILISRTSDFVTADGVDVIIPGLFYGQDVAVHGLDGILPLRRRRFYARAQHDPRVPTAVFPESSPSPSVSPDSRVSPAISRQDQPDPSLSPHSRVSPSISGISPSISSPIPSLSAPAISPHSRVSPSMSPISGVPPSTSPILSFSPAISRNSRVSPSTSPISGIASSISSPISSPSPSILPLSRASRSMPPISGISPSISSPSLSISLESSNPQVRRRSSYEIRRSHGGRFVPFQMIGDDVL